MFKSKMFKFKMCLAIIAIFLSVSIQSATSATTGGNDGNRVFRVQNGQLSINGKPEQRSFSMVITSFNYLFLYVPSRGLFIISDKPFEGSVERGKFDGKTLSMNVEDMNLKIESSAQILSEESVTTAWVKFDSNFTLDEKSIAFGYGDKPADSYEWLNRLKKNQP